MTTTQKRRMVGILREENAFTMYWPIAAIELGDDLPTTTRQAVTALGKEITLFHRTHSDAESSYSITDVKDFTVTPAFQLFDKRMWTVTCAALLVVKVKMTPKRNIDVTKATVFNAPTESLEEYDEAHTDELEPFSLEKAFMGG